jgi:hypothetical protein
MSNLLLTFNGPASEAMGANTRIRVKTMKRGGVEYVALRPSYRVSGKNAMIRTAKAEDGVFTAELPEAVLSDETLALPALKSNGSQYLMADVGYGWFLLKPDQELNEKKDAIITITKARKTAGKKGDGDDTSADTSTPAAKKASAKEEDKAAEAEFQQAAADAAGEDGKQTEGDPQE